MSPLHFALYLIVGSSFFGCINIVNAQKPIARGKAELVDGPSVSAAVYGDEVMNKAESQLINVLELLQAYQEAAPMPLKIAEKRRNKFEFIRFGRRRR